MKKVVEYYYECMDLSDSDFGVSEFLCAYSTLIKAPRAPTLCT